MKFRRLIFPILLGVFTYLSLIDNISINIGDEDTYISRNDWVEERIKLNDVSGILKKKEVKLLDDNDFNKYLFSMKNSPFHRHRITYMDTTGDGSNEEVHSIVRLNQEGCHISNLILKDGEIIWEDNALIDEDLALSLVEDVEFIDNYGPYALFYLGISESNFIDGLKKGGDFDERKKQILRSMNDGQDLVDLYNSQLSKNIDNYQGKYLFKMSDGLKQIYMWDKESEYFKCIYKNESLLS